MPKPSPKKLKDEFAPDAWERFERLVQSATKIGHMPHDAPPVLTERAHDVGAPLLRTTI